ncbi:MAG: bifunctional aldolase/short-chain dehydrogenase [Propionivibrio sp.]|uniref:Bifunctional aldolase/short-chain dehydrogenase n=1 Tax=Candidatus Propionivibrio dominans TaxID=2954373 RepID=A0A9D7F9E3_9RHOO|nr:bifunctional aldolase/short-chain dehydrogenase [Candidatus Propionivibrio dominans]
MKSILETNEIVACTSDIEQRVYTSRLLGRDKTLVLHGGGNTSVKAFQKNPFGEDEDILFVKGSGWDLEKIAEEGFSPVRLDHLKRLAQLKTLSDPMMVNELVTHMTRASAPVPSVEAILHAILPYKFVDHTHADAVVTVTNAVNGEARIREIYGDSVVVIPYVMPGFDLARLCAEEFVQQADPQTIGMVLLNHGIFSFGETARESYERMIDLVERAEVYLKRNRAWDIEWNVARIPEENVGHDLALLRKNISAVAGFPMLMARHADAQSLSFAGRKDVATIAQQGPATPDHVIRTKRLPMLGRDVHAYAEAYRAYFAAHEPQAKERKTMLDPAPRLVLDPQLGMCAVGRSAKDAAIVAEIYAHTMEIVVRATALGGYCALPARDIFDVEYWDLEQAKLKKGSKPAAFAGEVALVTGAASGIGKACVDALLARGAAVVGIDLNPSITSLYERPDFLGLVSDVASEEQLKAVLERTANAFGGLDMLVLNAGIFPGGCRIDALGTGEWRKVMQVNLDANFVLMREAYPYLKLAPRGGRVVIIGSKNVPAPGPGAAAYSASKAALNQLARVAALEWGGDNIRINSLHPNAVFDTGIWTEEVLASRAKHYGLTVDAYKKNNLLKTEVTSRDVAELAAEMCGVLFAKTTGAQLPVDGGNDRVI